MNYEAPHSEEGYDSEIGRVRPNRRAGGGAGRAGEEGRCDGVGLTRKYCDKDIKHDEDNDGEDKRMTEGKWRRKAMKMVLFKTLSSSPTLRFVISHRSRSRFSPSL